MRNLAVLVIHLIATLARLLGPGGVRSLVAESLLLKHQLLIVNRSRQRSPNLSAGDRILAALLALLARPTRLLRSAIALKPSTLLAWIYTSSHSPKFLGSYGSVFPTPCRIYLKYWCSDNANIRVSHFRYVKMAFG